MNKLLKTSLSLALSFVSYWAVGQTVNTVAGNGIVGYSGDGGPATAAALNNPHGVFMSPTGEKYICDAGAHVIRKISTAGIITSICGTGTAGYTGDGGPAIAARINAPFDMVMDPAGNIYFCDESHHVRKINTSGIISTIAGNGIATFTGDGGAATAASFDHPTGIALDPSGNIYVSDQYNHRVRKITPAGVITTIAGTGSIAYTGDGGPATAAEFSFPNFLNFHSDGYLYITDNGNHCIRKYNPATGIVITIAGNGLGGYSGDGGPATSAQLWYPGGVEFDAAGNLFITDDINHVVRKVDLSGNISTVAGIGVAGFGGDGGPALSATFNTVVDIMFDAAGNYFIVDEFNSRVRGITVPPADNVAPIFLNDGPGYVWGCVNTPGAPVSNLTVFDPDTAQSLTCSVYVAPLHGTLTGFPVSMSSTGAAVYPAGTFTYIPAAGFYGTDTFTMRVSNGYSTAQLPFHVDIYPNNSGVITGRDTMCIGDTVMLADSIVGGVWTSADTTIATISSTGVVLGINPGSDTIFYSLPSLCNAGTVSVVVTVLTPEACWAGVGNLAGNSPLCLFPNPNTGNFTIDWDPLQGEADITITDVAGRTLFNKHALGGHIALNTGLFPGTYFVALRTPHYYQVRRMVITE